MSLVGFMLFAAYLMPLAVVGKEGVGLLRHIVYFSQTESVGLFQQIVIKTGPTYYIYMLIGLAGGNKIVPTAEALATW